MSASVTVSRTLGPKDLGQGDLGRGPGEPEAAVGTALAAHDVAAPQVRQDRLKERAGDNLGAGELLAGDVAVGRGGQFDRGAQRVVGTGGYSHGKLLSIFPTGIVELIGPAFAPNVGGARYGRSMRFGFVIPYADAREFAEIAALGEQQGWDGVFTWEAVWGLHAWVTLGAAAMVTERIRLGTLLTPASRWRPWDLASAVLTVDRLSGGRAVMGVGLGALNGNWTAFEDDEGRGARARKLDEGLAIYDGLMRGQPFTYDGRHYSAKPVEELVPDPPVQRPRPPVWVVGAKVVGKQRQPSLERAARWDGLLPAIIDDGTGRDFTGPAELADLVGEVKALRAKEGLDAEPYDVIIEGDSTGEFVQLKPPDPASWEAAGATWWIESWWSIERGEAGRAEVRRRVQAGPPR
jgi:hypothetical protein